MLVNRIGGPIGVVVSIPAWQVPGFESQRFRYSNFVDQLKYIV